MNKAQVIDILKQANVSDEDINAIVNKPKTLTYKVSAKGAISVYGFGRFPVTLYKEQWERVIDDIDNLKAFISENKTSLSVK